MHNTMPHAEPVPVTLFQNGVFSDQGKEQTRANDIQLLQLQPLRRAKLQTEAAAAGLTPTKVWASLGSVTACVFCRSDVCWESTGDAYLISLLIPKYLNPDAHPDLKHVY